MSIEGLDRFLERAILGLVLAILVFAPLAMGAAGVREFLVVQVLTMGVMFLWGLRMLGSPKLKFFWPPLSWIVLAFALYALARYWTAPIEYVARLEMIQTLLFAFLFFATTNNLTSRGSAEIISLTLVFLAAAISCFAVWQFMTHSSRVWDVYSPYHGRATGTYISPNNFSCFLEMLLPLALAYLLTGRVKPMTRVFLGYAALAMGAGLAVTFSRGGWVAAAIGVFAVLAVLICHSKHRIPALVMLAILLGAGTIFVTSYLSSTLIYVQRVSDSSSTVSSDLELRRPLWKAAEEMWMDHFWFGVGPAHYDYRFRQYNADRVEARPDRAHNDYLNLLADWGTVGGIIIAAGMAIFAAGLLKIWKAVWPAENELGRGMSNRFAFFVGGSAGLLALAAHSVVDFNLHIPANAVLGVVLLALLTGQLRNITPSYQAEFRAPARLGLMVALAAGIFYFGWQGSRRLQESSWIERAQNPNLTFLDAATLLEKGFAAEPKDFETAYRIGELYRQQSFLGGSDYESTAQTAMDWYGRAMTLDPFDGYDDLGYGMCLDWLCRSDEAEPFYSRAEALDPNGYFTVANIGWHYIQTGDYAAARVWLERSYLLEPNKNTIFVSYWDMVQAKLTERASGRPVLPAGF